MLVVGYLIVLFCNMCLGLALQLKHQLPQSTVMLDMGGSTWEWMETVPVRSEKVWSVHRSELVEWSLQGAIAVNELQVEIGQAHEICNCWQFSSTGTLLNCCQFLWVHLDVTGTHETLDVDHDVVEIDEHKRDKTHCRAHRWPNPGTQWNQL